MYMCEVVSLLKKDLLWPFENTLRDGAEILIASVDINWSRRSFSINRDSYNNRLTKYINQGEHHWNTRLEHFIRNHLGKSCLPKAQLKPTIVLAI